MERKLILLCAALMLCGVAMAGDSEKAADAKKSLSYGADVTAEEFDNGMAAPVDPVDYDKIASELVKLLKLSPSQEKQVRAALKAHKERYAALLDEYRELGRKLSKQRGELLGLRRDMKQIIDNIPNVVSQKLEADQRDEYKKLLDAGKAAKEGKPAAEVKQPLPQLPPPEPAAAAPVGQAPAQQPAENKPKPRARRSLRQKRADASVPNPAMPGNIMPSGTTPVSPMPQSQAATAAP